MFVIDDAVDTGTVPGCTGREERGDGGAWAALNDTGDCVERDGPSPVTTT